MKRFCLLIVTLITVSTLTAQTIVGKWSAPQLGLELTLNPDFTYTFAASSGRYTVQGNFIYFQDATSGGVTPYSVSLNEDTMIFVDRTGVPIRFIRPGGQAVPEIAAGRGAEVARAGGSVLTQGDVDVGIDIIQFIVDCRLTGEERAQLTVHAIDDFRANPGQFVKDVQTLAASRGKLGQITDPIQVGLLRQALLVAFHGAARNFGPTEQPLFMRILNRYVQVLVYDEPSQLVLTNKDLDAYFEYTAFLYELNTGKKIALPVSVRDSVKNDLIARFPILPVQEKQFYCGMGIIWNYFQYAWKSAAEAQRRQIVVGMFSGSTAPAPGINYGSIQPRVGTSAPSGQEMDDDTFNTLKNVMLIDHVGTMNAWSAIGDSPYYYEIVDY